MYCSSCGVVVAQGLSYCNYCGAKLSGVKGDSIIKSPEVKPESLVWGMVAVLVFGFVAIVFLMMAMKMVGLNVGQILAFTILSFLIMLLVEGVFGHNLFRFSWLWYIGFLVIASRALGRTQPAAWAMPQPALRLVAR